MRFALIGLCIFVVLGGAAAAHAKSLPVNVTAGNIAVGCTRTPNVASGFDEVDFFLTGMTGKAGSPDTDGSQVRINVIAGRWTAGSNGAFWVSSQDPSTLTFQNRTTNFYWRTPTYSTINLDSCVSGATIWTNHTPDPVKGLPNGGGRGPQTSGNLYNYFSGAWYTTNYDADIVYPYPKDKNGNRVPYAGLGTDSTYLASLYVTSATPDTGIAYDGEFSFTYGGGIIEVVHFATVPEPSTLILLGTSLAGLAAYAWRKRK
jgi:hypothetical protein